MACGLPVMGRNGAVFWRQGEAEALGLICHDLAENGIDPEVNPQVGLTGRQFR
jgi:hypothetical protein